MFDHEKLDVYQLQLEFIAWVSLLLDEVQAKAAGKSGEIRNHLDRASLSVLFNLAEGNAKRPTRTRAKFFDDARGSAAEAAACLDALVAKGLSTPERILEGKKMLVRVLSMLTKLVQRLEDQS